MMQLLKNKGFQTRKIGFHGKKYGGISVWKFFTTTPGIFMMQIWNPMQMY
jgi:hypothetical protein